MRLRTHQPDAGGHRTAFPGKGGPTTFTLTPHAKQVLAATVVRTGLSASDVVEWLIRTYAMRVPCVEA
jgi:hypothetical protein